MRKRLFIFILLIPILALVFINAESKPNPKKQLRDLKRKNVKFLENNDIYIVIAKDETGNFTSIQEALDMIPVEGINKVFIYIKKGIYEEKIYIKRNFVTLIGEDRKGTIIQFAELRQNWVNAHKNSDWGAAVVNIEGENITLLNLTVYNNYGDIHNNNDHQFAIRLAIGTKIITQNCDIIAAGSDTISLWDTCNGMYYHDNCYFEGYTDMVCPRGSCYISNSQFLIKKVSAVLWHDGSCNINKKMVVRNSKIDGVERFNLGRRHYDAQFYLIDCVFSKNMSKEPIFRVTYPENPKQDRPNKWGDRYYFYNSKYEGGELPWLKDNLNTAESNPGPDGINALWTFEGKWDPEKDLDEIKKQIKEIQAGK